MNFIFGLIVGGSIGIVLISLLSVNKINELERENKCLYVENKDLRYDNDELHNAEYRAMQYAKTIKTIEDIYFGQGTIVDKHDAIGKVFKGEE